MTRLGLGIGFRLEALESRALMSGGGEIAVLERMVAEQGGAGEVLINDTAGGIQELYPTTGSVAMDTGGNYVVTWTGGGEVYARRFDASGQALGAGFGVNTTTVGEQADSAVAMDGAGNFVVAWSGNGTGDGKGVFARRYNAAGEALGGEFRVNTVTANDQYDPAVAVDGSGNFVVAWTSAGQDGNKDGVYARRYDAGGAAVGGEFRVNTYTDDDQSRPAVAMEGGGSLVIVWHSRKQGGPHGGIYGQRYSAAGAAVGGEFRVNAGTDKKQADPSVAMDAAGNFVVTFTAQKADGSSSGIVGRRFDSGGTAVGAEFVINSFGSGKQQYASVAMGEAGWFIVTWSSFEEDGSGYGVYSRRFDAAGNAVEGAVRVNVTVANDQVNSAVAVRGTRFMIVWSGNGPGDTAGVFGLRPEAVVIPAGIVVSPLSGTTTEGGGSASFSIVLESRPAAEVTISLASSDASEGTVSVGSLTFTPANWDVPQTVVVRGVDDGEDDGDVVYRIVAGAAVSDDAGYDGMDAADVSLINADDDVPVVVEVEVELSASGETLNYLEDDGSVVVDGGMTISASGAVVVEGATVVISGGYVAGEDRLQYSERSGITGVWDAGGGALTLSGRASVQEYQAALRSIMYSNSSQNPSEPTRTVTFTIRPGRAPAIRRIHVVAVNDAPRNSVPSDQPTPAGRPVMFTGERAIRVGDVDAGDGVIQVMLSAQYGKLSLANRSRVQVLSGGDYELVLRGTVSEINRVLDGLSFVPAEGFAGRGELRIVTNDLGNHGVGGALSDSDTIGILVVAAPRPPEEPPASPGGGDAGGGGGGGQVMPADPGDGETRHDPGGGQAAGEVVVQGGEGAAGPGEVPPLPAVGRVEPHWEPLEAVAMLNHPGPPIGGPGVMVTLPAMEKRSLMYEMTLLQDGLNSLAQQFGSEATASTLLIGNAAGAAALVTVGYVIWAIRGASLLSSLLASLPAWRWLDPLPVLQSREDEERKRRRKRKAGVAEEPEEDERELRLLMD